MGKMRWEIGGRWKVWSEVALCWRWRLSEWKWWLIEGWWLVETLLLDLWRLIVE